MKPIRFTKHETLFTSPETGISPLPTKFVEYGDGTKAIVSCWKTSLKERIKILLGSSIYLVVLGNRLPPVLLSIDGDDVGAKDDSDS